MGRAMLALALALLVVFIPFGADAQPAAKTPRIGVLFVTSPARSSSSLDRQRAVPTVSPRSPPISCSGKWTSS